MFKPPKRPISKNAWLVARNGWSMRNPRRYMTVCVAAICDNGKTLILVADKMIGIGFIESEPDINKLLVLDKDWWVLFAGNNISPVFDIVDYAKLYISEKKKKDGLREEASISLNLAMESIRESYDKKRREQAEILYLKPIGWTMDAFNADGQKYLPDFAEIKSRISDYSLDIELLIAGFSDGNAYIFSLTGTDGALINRHDIPGFYSIGSGGIGAIYMLYYRDMSYKKPAREAVYYAMEAKLFGEQASGVGEETDLYIATSDGKFITLSEDTIEKKLVSVWNKLRPKWMGRESRLILNSLPELNEFEQIKEESKSNRRKSPQKSDKEQSAD